MSALKKKDYYQFCYDENEKEASFDDDNDNDIDEDDEIDSESDNETYDLQHQDDPLVTPTSTPNATAEHVHIDTPYYHGTTNADFVTPTDNNVQVKTHVDTPYYNPHSEEDNLYAGNNSEEQELSYHLTPTIHNNRNVKKQRPHLSLLFDEEQMMMVDNMFDQSPSPCSFNSNNTTPSSDGVGSPSSMESFTIDGYVIEIDEETNTININTSPSSYSDTVVCYSPHYDMPLSDEGEREKRYSTGGNHLCVPSSFSSDLSSSGVSLDFESNPSPLSSAPSLTTEIDRLRNLNSLICDLDSSNSTSPTTAMMTSLGGMNKRREGSGGDRYFRRISGSSTASDSVAVMGKSTKSLESLKSRSSTTDSRKSPLDFLFRTRNKMTPAKSDCELSRIKKSSRKSSKKSKEGNSSTSIFRLKRSNSVSLKQKYRLSVGSFTKSDQQIWTNGGLVEDKSASSELILQQPSPFVRTIFQFVATDEDEMFPPPPAASSFENLTTLPIYTCTRNCKMFMDFNKSNSLSRRHKHKNNLSSVVRTITQDAHEPVLLSTGRRICEMSEFLIAVTSYLDRIRKAKEIVEDTPTQSRLPQQPQSNRFERLSLRKSYMLPLTLHERFSKHFDNTSFNQDLILTGVNSRNNKKKYNSANKSHSSNKLVSSNDDLLSASGFLNRSKSLKNISFGSLRRKSKQVKHKGATTDQDDNVNITSTKTTTTMAQDMTTSSNESRGCTSENITHRDDGDNIKVRMNNKSTCCCQLEQLAMVRGAEESGERRSNVLKENTCSNNIIIECNSNTSCEGCCRCNHCNCGSADERKNSKTWASNNINNSSSSSSSSRKSSHSKQNVKRRGKADEVKNNVYCNCSSTLLNSPDNLSINTQQNQQQKQTKTSTNNSESAVCEQTSEKQSATTTIRYLAGKLKKINNKRNKIPDVEYLAKTDKQEANEQNNQQSQPPPGVNRLRQQFEGSSPSSPEMDQRASSPEIIVDVPPNVVTKEKKRSGGGLRRSLSWRLKKDKGNKSDRASEASGGDASNNTSPQQLSKIKEKTDKPNKFSSIRSMFEPLSPSEKKKFSVEQIHNRMNSPVRHRKSNKSNNNKTERVVSLRYSRINGDDMDSSEPLSPYHSNSSSTFNSPPSSPDVTVDLTRRIASNDIGGVASAESGEAISSELYTSSDSSPISPNDETSSLLYSQQKKGFQSIIRSQVC